MIDERRPKRGRRRHHPCAPSSPAPNDMKPITYCLQFRGKPIPPTQDCARKPGAAGAVLSTSLTEAGIKSRFIWSNDDAEAFLESALTFTGAKRFEELATIVLPRGHVLILRGRGELARSPDAHLRQGTVVWEVASGEGQFCGGTRSRHIELRPERVSAENSIHFMPHARTRGSGHRVDPA
jgi:hypothetical protein